MEYSREIDLELIDLLSRQDLRAASGNEQGESKEKSRNQVELGFLRVDLLSRRIERCGVCQIDDVSLCFDGVTGGRHWWIKGPGEKGRMFYDRKDFVNTPLSTGSLATPARKYSVINS